MSRRSAKTPQARWWEARRAQNRKPATYRCPLCGELLPALSDHMLLFPEGDHGRRRHAHMACVMEARSQGGLLTREEWERKQAPKAASTSATPVRGKGSGRSWWPPRLWSRG
jgi:hypothetical protein